MARKECVTDNLVRDYFNQFSDDVIIEPQSSSEPKIQKLLANASKRGNGAGYPDFIIRLKKESSFIIVVEDKADKKDHESTTHKEYSKYAVDGVLLYASFLAKEYDVLAIAVSGTQKDNLKISHYVHLKDEPKAFPYFADKFLAPITYFEGVNSSEEKRRQDYDKLLEYTRTLNTKLHTMHIDEAERCILASCILLALRIPEFKEYYQSATNSKKLADKMINDVMGWFRGRKVGQTKIDTINSKYSAIKGMFSSDTTVDTKLKDLIDDMSVNIDSFKKTNRYYDVLGQLFVAFLRYANTSNDLGVVLTPTHITQFFAEIAGVNKNSVVFDNCTGTCGFLIAAMSKMIDDAKGDKEKELEIKEHQLIGIELGDKMYCLAASNMAIHGDGKTNIYLGSGIDPKLIDDIKKDKAHAEDPDSDKRYYPTVGLLNPPYKADKQNDVEELEFVKWNLEALVEGGTCVAIVPMQCAINNKKNSKIMQLKTELLEHHTLEAVFSMPDDLFYNSDKSVVTCVMVFTAHKPHPEDKETFFGYYKDDGFEKRKNLGRIDARRRWEKRIKDKWASLYRNRKVELGYSVMHHVKPEDEWCAEAFMPTDLSVLPYKDFVWKMRNYVSYLILSSSEINVSVTADSMEQIMGKKLFTYDWEEFRYDEIFDIRKGFYNKKPYEDEDGDIPFIGASDSNNGITSYHLESTIDSCSKSGDANNAPIEDKIFSGNCITVSNNGSVGCAFYQNEQFTCTHDVNPLYLLPEWLEDIPSHSLNVYIAMFLTTIIEKKKFRWAYGRKWRPMRMPDSIIKLPVIPGTRKPDWAFMEKFIKELPYSNCLK